MATKNVTFDPDAGVPKGVNLTIHTGSDFATNFNVVNTSNIFGSYNNIIGIIKTIYGIPNGFCSEKSKIESASVSISRLSANPSSAGSILTLNNP